MDRPLEEHFLDSHQITDRDNARTLWCSFGPTWTSNLTNGFRPRRPKPAASAWAISAANFETLCLSMDLRTPVTTRGGHKVGLLPLARWAQTLTHVSSLKRKMRLYCTLEAIYRHYIGVQPVSDAAELQGKRCHGELEKRGEGACSAQ